MAALPSSGCERGRDMPMTVHVQGMAVLLDSPRFQSSQAHFKGIQAMLHLL